MQALCNGHCQLTPPILAPAPCAQPRHATPLPSAAPASPTFLLCGVPYLAIGLDHDIYPSGNNRARGGEDRRSLHFVHVSPRVIPAASGLTGSGDPGHWTHNDAALRRRQGHSNGTSFFSPGNQEQAQAPPPFFFPPQEIGSRSRYTLYIRIKTVVFPHSFPTTQEQCCMLFFLVHVHRNF